MIVTDRQLKMKVLRDNKEFLEGGRIQILKWYLRVFDCYYSLHKLEIREMRIQSLMLNPPFHIGNVIVRAHSSNIAGSYIRRKMRLTRLYKQI